MNKSIAFAPQVQVLTVQGYVRELGIEPILARAISFHPEIESRLLNTRVEFDAALSRAAGRFSTKDGITLHPGLRYAARRDLIETFLHEVAHAMQWFAYGKINHQASWWEMMHQLGQKPVRTHNIAECGGKLTAAKAGLNAEDLGL